MEIRTYKDANELLVVAREPLERSGPADALLYGVTSQLARGPDPTRPVPYMAAVVDGARLVAAAVMTPPLNILLFAPDQAALPGAVDLVCTDLRRRRIPVPGVLAQEGHATAFAERWSRQTGVAASRVASQWVYMLRQVNESAITAPGYFRLAEPADRELLVGWQGENQRSTMESKILAGQIGVWANPVPVSMAGQARPVGGGGAISLVYTPPEERGRGYATACVASLCLHSLRMGWAFCSLHADQANAAANRVYEKTGFARVCAYAMYHFG